MPPPRPSRARQPGVQVHQREREHQRAQVRHVRRDLHELHRQRQVQGDADDHQHQQHERVVEPARVVLDPPAQPGRDRVRGVGEVAHECLEDAELRGEQHQHAHHQHQVEHALAVQDAQLFRGEGRHVRRGRLLPGHGDDVRHQHGRQQHAEHRADEEHRPLVDQQQPVPALPQRSVRRSVHKGHTDRAQLLLPAAQAGEEPHAVAHAVTLVAVVAHRVPVQAGRQRREPGQAAELRRRDAGRWCGRGDQAAQALRPHRPRHDRERHHDQDQQQGADEHPVRELQGTRHLAGARGDQEDDHEQADGEQPHVLDLVRSVAAAGDQREESLSGARRPAAEDEREVEDQQ